MSEAKNTTIIPIGPFLAYEIREVYHQEGDFYPESDGCLEEFRVSARKLFAALQPNLNDIQVWEINRVTADLIAARRKELVALNVEANDWRFSTP
jgi:hypothetical protein